MAAVIEFGCYLCDLKFDTEEKRNNHSLWKHGKYVGFCSRFNEEENQKKQEKMKKFYELERSINFRLAKIKSKTKAVETMSKIVKRKRITHTETWQEEQNLRLEEQNLSEQRGAVHSIRNEMFHILAEAWDMGWIDIDTRYYLGVRLENISKNRFY